MNVNLTDPISLLEAFVLLLAASVLVALVTRRTILPYSVGLVVLGLVVSILDLPIELTLGPEVLLAVLLPALVFDAAYRTDARLLFSTLPAVVAAGRARRAAHRRGGGIRAGRRLADAAGDRVPGRHHAGRHRPGGRHLGARATCGRRRVSRP